MEKRGPGGWPFADVALARRLEGAEGRANVESVAARARLSPERGAVWTEIAGAWAMFDGVDSPLTQTFGLGLFGDVGSEELALIEAFYAGRGAPVFHEVSPLAEQALFRLLHGRGYEPFEFTTVLFRSIEPTGGAQSVVDGAVSARDADGRGANVKVSVAGPDAHEVWTMTAAEGWSEYPELAGFMQDIGRVTVERAGAHCFLATLGGEPAGTGVLSIHGGVGLLAGASTVPSARRNGVQTALLDARLRFAAEQGCDIAMMGASPGSASQRNAERNGFRVAYTRLKWKL
ncbi:MAG: GNAT family N-acetyltransferase [Acidobacteria bacterium]|nr:MAG: GNAT family N-acetyltransferase [Acidobacteriota bacterium]